MMKRISIYWKALALPLMMGAAMTFALTACEPEPTYEELRESFEYDPAQVTEQITGTIYGVDMNGSLLFRENRTAALSSYGYSWDNGFSVSTNLYEDWEVSEPDRGGIYAWDRIHEIEDSVLLYDVYYLLTLEKPMYDPAADRGAESLPTLAGQTWYGKCTVGYDIVRAIALEFQDNGRVLRSDTTFAILSTRHELELVDTDSYTYDWRTENNVLRLSRISGQSVGMGVAMTERMVAERATHVDKEPLPDGTEILFIDLGEEASLFINHWSRIPYTWGSGFLPEY